VHYREFAEYLRNNYPTVVRDDETCLIFDLVHDRHPVRASETAEADAATPPMEDRGRGLSRT
jgi:hypothetical protein